MNIAEIPRPCVPAVLGAVPQSPVRARRRDPKSTIAILGDEESHLVIETLFPEEGLQFLHAPEERGFQARSAGADCSILIVPRDLAQTEAVVCLAERLESGGRPVIVIAEGWLSREAQGRLARLDIPVIRPQDSDALRQIADAVRASLAAARSRRPRSWSPSRRAGQ